jgi:integrase
MERLVYPVIGDRPVDQIRRSEITALLDGIEDNAGPVQADAVLSFIRATFNWYAARNDDFRSPIVRGMSRTKPKERARARILTDDELVRVWLYAERNGAFGALTRFILLTAARRDEALRMTWAEITGGDWVLPASRNKTKVELVRPLSRAAQAILEERQRPIPSEWVFSNGRAPLGGISNLKAAFDKAAGVSDYTTHDLRRSARSLMSRAGVDADIAERCLGHVIPGVRGVYDRHEYHREKQQAYEALAGLIERIVRPSANVVGMRQ